MLLLTALGAICEAAANGKNVDVRFQGSYCKKEEIRIKYTTNRTPHGPKIKGFYTLSTSRFLIITCTRLQILEFNGKVFLTKPYLTQPDFPDRSTHCAVYELARPFYKCIVYNKIVQTFKFPKGTKASRHIDYSAINPTNDKSSRCATASFPTVITSTSAQFDLQHVHVFPRFAVYSVKLFCNINIHTFLGSVLQTNSPAWIDYMFGSQMVSCVLTHFS